MIKNILISTILSIVLCSCTTRLSPPSDRGITVCINNLRTLNAAKEQFALENDLRSGIGISRENAALYIKGGIDTLKCPAKGEYDLKTIGAYPECSTHGKLSDAIKIRSELDEESHLIKCPNCKEFFKLN